jgi:hypothetical protein
METNEYYFFEIVRLLNKHNLLTWIQEKSNLHTCHVTGEFYIEVRFYENQTGNNVFDFSGVYKYRTIDNKIIDKRFLCRLRESENSAFQLFDSKAFFRDIISKANNSETNRKMSIKKEINDELFKNYLALKEISNIKSIMPFNEVLYMEIISKCVIPNLI